MSNDSTYNPNMSKKIKKFNLLYKKAFPCIKKSLYNYKL